MLRAALAALGGQPSHSTTKLLFAGCLLHAGYFLNPTYINVFLRTVQTERCGFIFVDESRGLERRPALLLLWLSWDLNSGIRRAPVPFTTALWPLLFWSSLEAACAKASGVMSGQT